MASEAARTSDGRIDRKDIGLLLEDLCALRQNPQRLLLRQSALAIEVVFQERDVRLRTILAATVEELLRGRLEHRWGLHLEPRQ